MIYADNILKKDTLILRNLNTNALNTSSGTWSGALTGYGFYNVTYETPTTLYHLYYQRCDYKFTTTNQSPTWCQMYIAGGYQGGATVNNPVANTIYRLSALVELVPGTHRTNTSGTIYNGPSNAISGVSSYVKDVLVYDVTELYYLLKDKKLVKNKTELKTWCDQHLQHVPKSMNYNISSLINNTSSKVTICDGTIIAKDFVETDGMNAYSVSTAISSNTYFDTAANFSVYNNSSNGTVTHTRVTDTTSPFYPEHKYVIKITTNGTASPGAGGFYCGHTAKANGIFVEKIVAKVPIGYNVCAAANAQGTGGTYGLISDASGTGDWKEYTILYKCGSSGTFSTGGHVYLNGPNNTSVTWYVAYCNNCDITGKEYLKYFTTLPYKDMFGTNCVFSRKFDCLNEVPNGNCQSLEPAMLPPGWSYDTSDKAGKAHASIVQPVGAVADDGYFMKHIKINPYCRYKISFYIKCKGDMTSFLTAIRFRTIDNISIAHSQVMYKNGTKTYLTAALTPGATTVTVASNANWAARSYSRLGFRNGTEISWHDKGSFNPSGSNGIVTGVSGSTVITLRTAYTGETIPANTYIVEGYDGSTYPYPIQKGNLPTNNTWKYVEGYFGVANKIWDGNDADGTWSGIPLDAIYMDLLLNIYSNNGTVPIKYADIRIEPVGGTGNHRYENKIQLGK